MPLHGAPTAPLSVCRGQSLVEKVGVCVFKKDLCYSSPFLLMPCVSVQPQSLSFTANIHPSTQGVIESNLFKKKIKLRSEMKAYILLLYVLFI